MIYSPNATFSAIGSLKSSLSRSAAFAVSGSGKATNFAAGTADRFPAWGTSQIAVLPAVSPTTYPAKRPGCRADIFSDWTHLTTVLFSAWLLFLFPRNPCLSKAPASIDTLSAKLKATTRTTCGSSPTTTGFDTRLDAVWRVWKEEKFLFLWTKAYPLRSGCRWYPSKLFAARLGINLQLSKVPATQFVWELQGQGLWRCHR